MPKLSIVEPSIPDGAQSIDRRAAMSKALREAVDQTGYTLRLEKIGYHGPIRLELPAGTPAHVRGPRKNPPPVEVRKGDPRRSTTGGGRKRSQLFSTFARGPLRGGGGFG
jgi:hypothetical protein